jgi:hypothetical protein
MLNSAVDDGIILANPAAKRTHIGTHFRSDAKLTACELVEKMVGRDGIEPPTPGFSVLCSTN